MKLTKGKISKLLNTKKQSKKKYRKNNKPKKSNFTNTFRKKRHLNLANKTLKRVKGGEIIKQYDSQNENVAPNLIEETSATNATTPLPLETTLDSNPIEETTTSTTLENTPETTPIEETTTSTTLENPSETTPIEETTTSTTLENPPQTTPIEETTTSTTLENPPETTPIEEITTSTTLENPLDNSLETTPIEEITTSTTLENPLETNSIKETTTSEEEGVIVPPEIQEYVNTNESNNPLANQEEINVVQNNVEIEDKTEIPEVIPIDNKTNEMPTAVETQNNVLPENVSKSLNTVLNYLTNEITHQITENINLNNNNNNQENIQNGFDAVNQATEIMATPTSNEENNLEGGKPKRKKFKLTKKSRKSPKNK
jgi:hypothetical protein